jgi:hypothetical protein
MVANRVKKAFRNLTQLLSVVSKESGLVRRQTLLASMQSFVAFFKYLLLMMKE